MATAGAPKSDTQVYDYDVRNGQTIKEFARKITEGGKKCLYREYMMICKDDPNTSPYNVCKANADKNRYNDIYCLDRGRVVLREAKGSDYIHANYVDGYKHRKAYICTQGPFTETYVNFWHMIWQEGVLVIMSLTKMVESGKEKCGQYWPGRRGKVMQYGPFRVQSKEIVTKTIPCYYAKTVIRIEHIKSAESRELVLLLYLDWPDFGVPANGRSFLKFWRVMKSEQETLLAAAAHWKHSRGPPIVVHCSAGVGRTGTLVALDILMAQFAETGRL